ncbi:Tim44/TimA family putative adaptor protein [Dongia soli]|uniref:Tim44/TimA family putative adaptor protein n=1 Tax=Dongia soli TaxID=600628 RepID=A0ABU5E7W0_9PROT|nr:Tim44/TimA family putative adaptor protein [Dongia soli]MDY0881992.1 Tim44/TimA family putative adaptor protein [Dongia soli]
MPLDLIFFAIVAVFLGWRLYTVLGRRTGNERSFDPFAKSNRDNAGANGGRGNETANDTGRADSGRGQDRLPEDGQKPAGNVVQLPRDQRRIEAAIAALPEEVRRGLEAIGKADANFNPVEFVTGAKIAFDMILTAFAKGDSLALRPLLNDEVYRNFNNAILERQKLNHKLSTTLVGIISHDIVSAELIGEGSRQEARIAIKFTSQQINVTTDSAGEVVDGSASDVATIVDVWTFARQVKARDPNWQLIATDSPQH